ncbi:MAG: HNH endonuclease [Elainellaceae cyanobacterium]
MSVNRYLTEAIRHQVGQRAQGLCEYCHCSEAWQYVAFTVDHIIPLDEGGSNELNNLALACFHCNRRKSNQVSARDEQSGQEVSLFNPRLSLWKDHFIGSADRLSIVGLTAIGRATVSALALNRDRILNIRLADIDVGRHPPSDDSIASS